MPMPISEQSQNSKPLATPPPPVISADAPSLKVRSSISHSEIGRNAIAAMHAGHDQALVQRPLDVAGRCCCTAKVPMIEAMMDTPPMTSG